MKGIVFLFAFLLTLLIASPGFAAGYASEGMKEKKGQDTTGAAEFGGERSLLSVTQMLGNSIENEQGENLGEIYNLLVDPTTGEIALLTVSIGETFTGDVHVVPFKAVDVSAENITLDMDKETLASAPLFEEGVALEELDRRSSEFFGVSPHWGEEEISPAVEEEEAFD